MALLNLIVFVIFGAELFTEGYEIPKGTGFTLRYSKLGLAKEHELMLGKIWKEAVLNHTLPPIKEDNYLIDFDVVSIELGTETFTLTPPNAISIASEGESYEILAKWRYYLDNEEHSGTMLISVSGVFRKQQMLFYLSRGAKPEAKLLPGECHASIEDVNFNVSPTQPEITLMVQLLTNIIKEKAQSEICSFTREELVTFYHHLLPIGQQDITLYEHGFPMYHDIKFAGEFVGVPNVQEDAIYFFIAGKCYSTIHNLNKTFPFVNDLPSPVLPSGSSRHMFEWITGDYMLKTLDYSLFQNGWLDEIDPIDSVNEHFGTNINATSLAKELPEFVPYSNRSIEFDIVGREPRRTSVYTSGIYTEEERTVRVNAILEGGIRETIVALDYVNHIKYLPYVLNDAVHLRIEEMESFASGESEAAKFFNKFRKENNPNYVLYRNDQLAKMPYFKSSFDVAEIDHLEVQLLEHGFIVGGDIGLNIIEEKIWPKPEMTF